MKKKIALLVLAGVAMASLAATCVVTNVAWTVIDGDFHYGAELRNETEADFLQHKFLVAFVEDDELIEEVTVEGCLRSLQSGASNFYSTHTEEGDPDDTVAISRLKWEDGLVGGQTSNGDLELSDIVVTRTGNTLTVTGTMTNDSNDNYKDARACVVIFNDDDQVVRVGFSSETDLDDGEDVDFDIEVEVPDDDNVVDRVEVWADALNDDEDDRPIDPVSKTNINPTECDEPTNTPTPGGPTNTPVPPTNTPDPSHTPTNTATPDPCD